MALADGTECDDGVFCTVDDACDAGICVGGPANDCGLTAAECMELFCDENSQTCGEQPSAPGAACQDPNDLCLVGGTCNNGLCVGGTPEDCFFTPVPDDCHVAVCNPQNGQCEPVVGNEGGACSDPNDLCTVNKTCTAGVCQGGNPMDCSGLTQGCNIGVCDVNTGVCVAQSVNNGDPCDDLDACTLGELCSNGTCGGGTPITACTGGDSCCPSNCNENNDSDCVLQILLMGDGVSLQTDWDTYRNGLTAAGVTWTEQDISSTFPTAQTLNQYNTIIWFAEGTLTVSAAESQSVVDWMAMGDKRIFVANIDFMWDMENGTPGQGEHNFYLAMGATFVGDYAGTGITTLDGVANDPIGGSFLAPTGLQLAGTGDSNGDYANPNVGPAIHAALYGSGDVGSGQSGMAHYTTSNYKLVWLGVNFHNGLTNGAQRNQLMANVINFFK